MTIILYPGYKTVPLPGLAVLIIELEENIENLHISESEKEPEPESEEDNRSPQEKMDDLLNSSLLQCLKTSGNVAQRFGYSKNILSWENITKQAENGCFTK